MEAWDTAVACAFEAVWRAVEVCAVAGRAVQCVWGWVRGENGKGLDIYCDLLRNGLPLC